MVRVRRAEAVRQLVGGDERRGKKVVREAGRARLLL